jgi:hypothetical protein
MAAMTLDNIKVYLTGKKKRGSKLDPSGLNRVEQQDFMNIILIFPVSQNQ